MARLERDEDEQTTEDESIVAGNEREITLIGTDEYIESLFRHPYSLRAPRLMYRQKS
jgi:hypothetical protein